MANYLATYESIAPQFGGQPYNRREAVNATARALTEHGLAFVAARRRIT
jgi:hypothetical protein